MFETLAKYISGKVVTILVVFGCACAGYWFYQHPEHLQQAWAVVKYAIAWLAFVAVLPWAFFLLNRWVVQQDSNAASGLLLIGYLIADAVVALLMVGTISDLGVLTWVVLSVGILTAGVYNFLACEYQSGFFES